MNPEKNANMEPALRKICPVTGLPVLRRPEWAYYGVGKGHGITAEVIGKQYTPQQEFWICDTSRCRECGEFNRQGGE